MRKINKASIAKPSSLNSKRCKNSLKKVINSRIIVSKKEVDFSDRYYKGPANDLRYVKKNLIELYKNKCAYCEAEYTNLDVDHYRPKASVNDGGKDLDHPGYYWLCYEWSNLIYVCKFCNQDHKKTKFPISGVRLEPNDWNTGKHQQVRYTNLEKLRELESPLLLNPEEHDFIPGTYLKYDRDGFPHGVDPEKRGQTTIEVCKLDREDLVKKKNKLLRKKLSDTFIAIMEHQAIFSDNDLLKIFNTFLEKCEEETEVDEEYTFFWKHIQHNFKEFVLEHPTLSLNPNGKFYNLMVEAHKRRYL